MARWWSTRPPACGSGAARSWWSRCSPSPAATWASTARRSSRCARWRERSASPPSALYRYFTSRDELLTALIARTYVEIDRVQRAAVDRALAERPGDPAAAWVEATAAYRCWALEHREEFGLVYGTPIPGYAAPEQATREVGRQAGAALFRVVAVALRQGAVDVAALAARGAAMSPAMREAMANEARGRGVDLPDAPAAGLAALGYGAWSKLQGLVAMEAFSHLPSVAPFAEEFFRAESAAVFAALVPPAPGAVVDRAQTPRVITAKTTDAAAPP